MELKVKSLAEVIVLDRDDGLVRVGVFLLKLSELDLVGCSLELEN